MAGLLLYKVGVSCHYRYFSGYKEKTGNDESLSAVISPARGTVVMEKQAGKLGTVPSKGHKVDIQSRVAPADVLSDFRGLMTQYVPSMGEGDWTVLVKTFSEFNLSGELLEIAQTKLGDRVMDYYGLADSIALEHDVQLMILRFQDYTLVQRVAILDMIREYQIVSQEGKHPDKPLHERIEQLRRDR